MTEGFGKQKPKTEARQTKEARGNGLVRGIILDSDTQREGKTGDCSQRDLRQCRGQNNRAKARSDGRTALRSEMIVKAEGWAD